MAGAHFAAVAPHSAITPTSMRSAEAGLAIWDARTASLTSSERRQLRAFLLQQRWFGVAGVCTHCSAFRVCGPAFIVLTLRAPGAAPEDLLPTHSVRRQIHFRMTNLKRSLLHSPSVCKRSHLGIRPGHAQSIAILLHAPRYVVLLQQLPSAACAPLQGKPPLSCQSKRTCCSPCCPSLKPTTHPPSCSGCECARPPSLLAAARLGPRLGGRAAAQGTGRRLRELRGSKRPAPLLH